MASAAEAMLVMAALVAARLAIMTAEVAMEVVAAG